MVDTRREHRMQRSQCRAPIMRLMIPKSRIRPDIFESDRVFTRSLHDGDHRHDDDIYKYGLQVILRPQSQRPPRTVARPTWTFGAIASARESAAHRQSQADRRTIHPLLLDATSRISRPAYQPLAMRPLSWLPVALVLFVFAQLASATTYLEHLAARNNRPQSRQTGVVNANICAAVSIYVPLNVTTTTCVNVTVDLGLSVLGIPLGTKIELLCTPTTVTTQVDIADK
jgi:hypothetical protein